MENAQKERFKELLDIVLPTPISSAEYRKALIEMKNILEANEFFLMDAKPGVDLTTLYDNIEKIIKRKKRLTQRIVNKGLTGWVNYLREIRAKMD